MTAERVQRFSDAVEETPSETNRALWRAALTDLRVAIRQARADGCETDAIQDATGLPKQGRFARGPAADTSPRATAGPG